MNDAFVGFLSSLLPLEERNGLIQRSITGEGSLQELVDDFQLSILHGLDLGDVLGFLEREGAAKISKTENCIRYQAKDIATVISEIKKRHASLHP